MAGFQSVWSIDIGKSALKAVHMRRERLAVEILAVDRVDFQATDTGIDSRSEARNALEIFAGRNTIRDPVVASYPGQASFSRFIKLPGGDARKLKEMVGHEAQQQIPFPMTDVVWDYHILGTNHGPGKEVEVGLFAARREAIDDFMLEFSSHGIHVDMISIGYLGLLNFVSFDINPRSPCVILDVGADHTDLLIVDEGRFWIRSLPVAGNDVTRTLAQKFRMNYAEAERAKKSATNSAQAVKIFTAVQPTLRDLTNEIHRSIGFYRSQVGEVKFQEMYLLGSGSKVIGLRKFLQEQLSFRVNKVQTINRLRLASGVDMDLLGKEFPGFAAAFGGAIQALGSGICEVNLIPREQQLQARFTRKRKWVFAAMAVLFLWLLYLGRSYQAWDENAGRVYRTSLRDWNKHSRFEKDMDTLKGEEKKLLAAMEGFLEFGASRRLSVEGMELVDQVVAGNNRAQIGALLTALGANPPDPEHPVLVKEKEKADQALVQERAEDTNRNLVWIREQEVELVLYPEIDPKDKKSRKETIPQIPVYRVTMWLAIVSRESEQAGREFLARVFDEKLRPLVKEYLLDDFVDVPEVPPAGPLIFKENAELQRGEGVRALRMRAGEADVADQGQFSYYQIQFYLSALPKPQAPAEEAPAPAPPRRRR